jgi:chromosome partitioning protein
MTRILAISNRKGGSGKTSTAVNLAAEWAARGQRVLLIDLDTQGHCALGLGVKSAKGSPTVHSLMRGQHRLMDTLCATSIPGLDLVPADPLFEHGSGTQDELTLSRALEDPALRERYDTIVLDTPPSLDALLLNALCAADRVLVPLQPHFLAGEGVRQLARVLFRLVSRGANERLRLLGFLPVMLDTRVGQHREVTQGLSQQFGAVRLLPGIRSDIRVAEAFGQGRPVRLHAPSCRAAADYAQALDALEARWG